MSQESLCIRTFAEVFRKRMNKKAQIKNFDPMKKDFQSEVEAKNNIQKNLSGIFNFYELLLNALIYIAIDQNEDGVPDINPTMATHLKNGKWEVHNKIKEIAQRKDMKKIVADYFAVNLIPNIPNNVLASVLDDVDNLVRNSSDIKKRKRNALTQAYLQQKSNATYLAEVYLLAICNGTNKITDDVLINTADKQFKDPLNSIDKLDSIINRLPAPIQQEPPKEILKEEHPYISELYAAYGEKEGIKDFCETHLDQYDEYLEDRDDRRIDYFAADSIRQGIRELNSSGYANQFTVLKEETWAGVKNTIKKIIP